MGSAAVPGAGRAAESGSVPGRIGDPNALAGAPPDAVERAHLVDRIAASRCRRRRSTTLSASGPMTAIELSVGAERQQLVVVLEQHDPLLGDLARRVARAPRRDGADLHRSLD